MFQRIQVGFHRSVVDTQELVLGSGHIDKIWLTLGAFLLEKLVHQLICWGFSQVGADDLLQRFPQMR